MQHKELGRDLLQKIFQPIEDIAAMESTPKVLREIFFFFEEARASRFLPLFLYLTIYHHLRAYLSQNLCLTIPIHKY